MNEVRTRSVLGTICGILFLLYFVAITLGMISTMSNPTLRSLLQKWIGFTPTADPSTASTSLIILQACLASLQVILIFLSLLHLHYGLYLAVGIVGLIVLSLQFYLQFTVTWERSIGLVFIMGVLVAYFMPVKVRAPALRYLRHFRPLSLCDKTVPPHYKTEL